MLLAEWTKQGATVESIEHQFLADSRVVVPSQEEQLGIMDALRENLLEFNRAVSKIEREIALLREFRKRLIADVVTGKLDIRAVAAALPETSEYEVQPIGTAEAIDEELIEDTDEADLKVEAA